MKPPAITIILTTLLLPLTTTAVRVCKETDVAIGYNQQRKAAMIANDCNAFHSTSSTDLCTGWDENYSVRCYNDVYGDQKIRGVEIKKGSRSDQYVCRRRLDSDNQCDNGVEVVRCCTLVHDHNEDRAGFRRARSESTFGENGGREMQEHGPNFP